MHTQESIPATRRFRWRPAVPAVAGVAFAAVIGLAITLAFLTNDGGKTDERTSNVAGASSRSGAAVSPNQPAATGDMGLSARASTGNELHVYIVDSEEWASALAQNLAGFEPLIAEQGGSPLVYDIVVINSPEFGAAVTTGLADLAAIRNDVAAGAMFVYDLR